MIRSQGRGSLGRIGVAALLVLASGSLAAGQAVEAAASKPLRTTVRVVDNQAEYVTLSVGKSAIVESDEAVEVASVVNPEVVEVSPISPRMTMVRGKSFGSTQVVLVGADGRKRAYTVVVEMDTSRLESAIQQAAPRANVRVSSLMDTIVLSGVVPDAETAQHLAQIAQVFSPKVQSHLRVAGTQQVLLRCTVAEVSRSAIRQLGVNGYGYGEDFFAVNQINQINPVSIGSLRGVNIERPQIPIGSPPVLEPQRFFFTADAHAFPQSTIYFGLPRAQTQVFVQALSENGLLRVLAEPNLVAISGQSASFLAGGEFPVPVPQDQNTVTIEWKQFGVQLGFTPAVLPGERIRLKVAPEVSELDFSTAVQFAGFVIPGLTKRTAETVIEVGNGQTFAIAGLLNDSARAVARRIPGLGDVPVLGALFRSVEYRKNQTELMILVTAELVAPLNPQEVPPVPGQHMTDPNDWQLYGLSMLEGDPKVGPVAAPAAQPVPEPTASGLYGPWGPAEYDEAQ